MDEKFIHAILFIKLNEKCKDQERKVFDHYIFRKYPRSNDLYEFFIDPSGLPSSEGILNHNVVVITSLGYYINYHHFSI